MQTAVTYLNSAGAVFSDMALSMLIQTSILIVILLGLDFILRKKVRAVFRYAIWLLVLVKLLLPVSLSIPTSPAYWFGGEITEMLVKEPVISVKPETAAPIIEETHPEMIPEIGLRTILVVA